MKDELVLKRDLIYIPTQDPIKTQLLQAHHNASLTGHLGQDKMYELVSRNYTWPNMQQWINQYINICKIYTCNKTPH